MRLNDALIANERYRGEPNTDEEGRTQWPVCVVWDDEVPGFGVRIYPPVRGRPSRKDFIVTWRLGLKSRTMAIGTYGVDCTLRQARRAAREALDLARRGQDPIEARQRALGIGTNEDLASRFLYEHVAAKKKPKPGGEPAGAAPGAGGSEAIDPAAAAAPAIPAGEAASETPLAEAASGEGADPGATSGSEAPASLPAAAQDAAPAEAALLDPAAPAPAASPAVALEPLAAGADPGGAAAAAAPSPSAAFPAAPEVAAAQQAEPQQAPHEAAPSPVRRGPTRVRLVPVPEGLHREIERRARAAGQTVAAYLQSLIDREPGSPAAEPIAPSRVEADTGPPPRGGEIADPPLPQDIFAQVQASQTADLATVAGDSFDEEEPGPIGD